MTVRLSALHAGRAFPPRKIFWYRILVLAEEMNIMRLEAISKFKICNDLVASRIQSLPGCSVVP
jgi:hypothetical protein